MKQKGKKTGNKTNKQSIQGPIFKQSNICVIKIPEGERENKTEKKKHHET